MQPMLIVWNVISSIVRKCVLVASQVSFLVKKAFVSLANSLIAGTVNMIQTDKKCATSVLHFIKYPIVVLAKDVQTLTAWSAQVASTSVINVTQKLPIFPLMVHVNPATHKMDTRDQMDNVYATKLSSPMIRSVNHALNYCRVVRNVKFILKDFQIANNLTLGMVLMSLA
jgi:UDP:flavonoid glycosyltransferase YjiC (YdhE family)